MNYTGQDLGLIKDTYSQIWKQLKAKYTEASGSLHFVFKGEFASLNDSFINLLKKNHYIFADDELKFKALNLIKVNKDIGEADIKKLLLNAPLNPECRIEIIWNDLDYELITKMQNDPLVDLLLTPKTKASIRIVLGRIVLGNIGEKNET